MWSAWPKKVDNFLIHIKFHVAALFLRKNRLNEEAEVWTGKRKQYINNFKFRRMVLMKEKWIFERGDGNDDKYEISNKFSLPSFRKLRKNSLKTWNNKKFNETKTSLVEI